ncbi:MAG: TnpV protein, partial [Longicatena sp.]
MMRKSYLKNHQQGLFFKLRATNKLNEHLQMIEEQAQTRMETMMDMMLQKNPAPNKETHQMQWVQHMNNLKNTIEEMILKEIVYN